MGTKTLGNKKEILKILNQNKDAHLDNAKRIALDFFINKEDPEARTRVLVEYAKVQAFELAHDIVVRLM